MIRIENAGPQADTITIDGDRIQTNTAADSTKIGGAAKPAPPPSSSARADRAEPLVVDAQGKLVTAGLIDPHTHVVYAGNRASEFAMRAEGKSYAEIAAAGGGILSTVAATRAASVEELVALARPRLRRMLERGVTTVESKSGYGLSLDAELKILRAMRALNERDDLPELVPTFLGAHAVPPEMAVDDYLRVVIEEMIPAVAEEKLAVFCDVFVERGFYTVDQGRRVLEAAKAHGLQPRLHVDQLTAGGGAQLAAEVGAVSADHLDHADDAGLAALAEAGTVAVLLPGAALYLGDEPPNARRFIDAGIDVALATDCNPGTSPTEDLPLMMTFGCASSKLTVEEAWRAVTVHAARAVGREDLGTLRPGASADVVIWNFETPAELPYRFGYSRANTVIKSGRVVYSTSTEKQRGSSPKKR